MESRIGSWLVIVVLSLATSTWGLGCNKSSSSGGKADEFFVVVGPPDVNAETGALTDAGLEKVKQASNQSNITIRVSGHASFSDAALVQLAQFKNVHRVLAPNSRISNAGIEKLKKTLPDVVVEK